MANKRSSRKNTGKTRTKKKNMSTGRAKVSQGATGENRRGRPRKVQETSLKSEIFLLCWFVCCFVLLLGSFGLGGSLTDWFTNHFYGWFGRVGILFPVVLFVTVFLNIVGASRRLMVQKSIFIVVSYLSLGALVHMFDCAINNVEVVDKAYKYYGMASISHEGGGVVCGYLADTMTGWFGDIGTVLICALLLGVSFLVISRKTFFKALMRGTQRWIGELREEHAYKKELAAIEREELKALKRKEKKEQLEEAKRAQAMRQRRQAREQQGAANRRPDRKQYERYEEEYYAEEAIAEEPVAEKPRELVINRGMPTFGEIDLRKSMPELETKQKETMLKEASSREKPSRETISKEAASKDLLLHEELTEGQEVKEEQVLPEDGESVVKTRQHKPSQEEVQQSVNAVTKEIKAAEKPVPIYKKPPISLLVKKPQGPFGESDEHLRETANKLVQVFKSFGVNVTMLDVSCGPSVTRYELQPEIGVKVSRIVALTDDIKLNLAVPDIRIEAPIPGKAAVGIEVPNASRATVYLRELLESREFRESKSLLAFPAGKDLSGKVIVGDLAKMPHMLVAGATGSGKSVFTNSIIMSMLFRADPNQVKFIVIDPKVVEFGVYNGIPHLMIPVVTDPKKAAGALNWAVAEMSERYKKFAEYHVRDLKGYNAKVAALEDVPELEGKDKPEQLPQIVIIIDELADLMMVAAKEVEDAICRLAQLARAAGIHMIIATQRPSVDVVTGLIKANVPSRVALSVASGVDSRTIIDMNGAEKLLGNGDMLFYPSGYTKPLRVQGAFVSDQEVADVVDYLKGQFGQVVYDTKIEERLNAATAANSGGSGDGQEDERDPYFADAARFIIEKEKASIGMLQRMFKIGFNRAARIMDQLSEAGVVGPEEGTKPRKLLMTAQEFEEFYNNEKGDLENED